MFLAENINYLHSTNKIDSMIQGIGDLKINASNIKKKVVIDKETE